VGTKRKAIDPEDSVAESANSPSSKKAASKPGHTKRIKKAASIKSMKSGYVSEETEESAQAFI